MELWHITLMVHLISENDLLLKALTLVDLTLVAGVIVFLWGVASATSGGSLRYQDVARAPQTPSGAPVDPVTAAMAPNDLGTVPPITEIPVPAPAPIPTSESKGSKSTRRARDRAIGDGEPS